MIEKCKKKYVFMTHDLQQFRVNNMPDVITSLDNDFATIPAISSLSDKKKIELVKNLLEYLLSKLYITKDQVLEKIKYIKDENDFVEYKYYEKHLEELALI
jgi:hypothetical protein